MDINNDIINIATGIVTVASLLANVLPNQSDNAIFSFAIKVVRFLAFNIDVKGAIR